MVCGLCACEPGTPHGDSAGEARCRYIFRYYNRAADGRLTSDEFRLVMFRCKSLNLNLYDICPKYYSFVKFRTMVRDIRERKGFSTDPADVENEANVSAKYAT